MSQGSPKPATSNSQDAKGDQAGMGWKIATIVLALSTVGALAWGIIRGNDLQDQVDTLNATVAEQQQTGQTAAQVTDTEIVALEKQVSVLEESLKTLENQSAATLSAASVEYDKMKSALQASQTAVAKLVEDKKATGATASQIAADYEAASQALLVTQQALADLLKAVADEDTASPNPTS
jgi:hypothetical protein